MTNKKSGDRVFTSATHSPVIAQLQQLVNSKDGFPWAQMLSPREMHFVYDMVASVEADKDFTLTPAQAKFGLRILHKLRLSRSHWDPDAAAVGEKVGAASARKGKRLSPRPDALARRRAKDKLRRAGVTWAKSTPSDLDLVEMLYSIGAIGQTVPRAKAREALMAWSQSESAMIKTTCAVKQTAARGHTD